MSNSGRDQSKNEFLFIDAGVRHRKIEAVVNIPFRPYDNFVRSPGSSCCSWKKITPLYLIISKTR